MVIFADDVGTGDVPGYSYRSNDNDNDSGTSPVVNMPNLQQFINEGTTFTDAHSTPLCATSRYMFLSGNYQHRGNKMGGVWAINYKSSQFRRGQQSIAQVFRENGYNTNMVGKWHIGGKVRELMCFSFIHIKSIFFSFATYLYFILYFILILGVVYY